MDKIKQNVFEQQAKQYKERNQIASRGGVVFFGSDVFCRMNFSELAASFGLNGPVYNRSLTHILPKEVPAYLDVCITDLQPKKVFLEVGNSGIANSGFGEAVENFEWLLYTIHQKTGAKIWLVYTADNARADEKLSQQFLALAEKYGCGFVDITAAMHKPRPELYAFEQLKPFIRLGKISFFEAMNPVIG